MARPLRIEYPGAFYHVINRGNAGQDIFTSRRDREKYVSYLEKMVSRFISILVEADEYLKQLSRYIHLNPLRLNMVESLDEYPWQSYAAFIGKEKRPAWLETDWLLKWFGKNRREAQRQYRDFVETIDIDNIDNPADDLVGGVILGGQVFIDWVKKTFLQSRQDHQEIPELTHLKPRTSVDAVIDMWRSTTRWAKTSVLGKRFVGF